ncbi:MAG: hypothetical protein LBJ83_03095 [Oscillospiraceae bacterium]|jgi:hypothetical protein|nr:hypothetical protein [Oscillospiraceae bacterium]
MSKSIIHAVTFVLALRNSWNDELVTSAFIFKLNGDIKLPTRKTFGYYVFMDLESSTFEVEISHPDFYIKKININMNDALELDLVLEVPLIPLFRNRLPSGCTTIYGKEIDPHTQVYAIRNKPRSGIQFLQLKDEDVIEVSNINKLTILGATLAAFDSENLTFDTFTVIKKCAQDIYKIDRKLPEHYKKGAPILKAYVGMVNEIGHFSIFVGDYQECHDYILKFVKSGSISFKAITLNDTLNKVQMK